MYLYAFASLLLFMILIDFVLSYYMILVVFLLLQSVHISISLLMF